MRSSIALVVLVAGCVRSGAGGKTGSPIDARGQAYELIACQAMIGDEHNQTDITATTLRGLNPRKLASRVGQESGVRAHPTDADVVVFVRQLRANDATSAELFVASLSTAFADVRLTRDGFTDVEPCWSPDGQRVLFASDRGGSFQLWRIDRDGNNLAPLTEAGNAQADRAPDARGERIAFSRSIAGQRAAIWLMNADGSGASAVTTGTGGASSADFVPGDHEPALAPDLSSVVFARRTAPERATLMRLEFSSRRLTELVPTTDGEDRLPRFHPAGDRLLLARTAPGEGLLGRRLVTCTIAGTELTQLTLDQRLACTGADLLAGASQWPVAAAQATPSELESDDAQIVLGQRTLGRFDLVRNKDGSGLQLATVAYAGKEAAGVFLPFKLTLPEATDVARVVVRATFALTVANNDASVRISVKDYVRNRFDVAWDGNVPGTRFVDAEFAFSSLAHVDRDGWIRIELVAELPAGQRAELALDAVVVDVFARGP